MVSCFIENDEDADEDIDPVLHITGPGMILTVTGVDECSNAGMTDCIIECFHDDKDEELMKSADYDAMLFMRK